MIGVNGRIIGPDSPCFIIAEAGVNHNGDPALAKKLVDAAARAGADAVKFQTFKTDKLMSQFAPKADYQKAAMDPTESQADMIRRLELPYDAFRDLFDYCRQRNVLFLSTPFDEESADFLDRLGVPAFKLPSGELTNIPFVAHVARKKRPLFVSTGMSWLGEVETCVRAIRDTGNHDIVLLHCVSSYPAAPQDTNLRAMETMRQAFGVPVGYSDHTLGIEVPLAAAALGACVIEKHFTLDRCLPGPDHQASIEPGELAAMVRGIRIVESALGHGRKEPTASETGVARAARRSLVAACDIAAGTVLTEEMIAAKRPGTGLPPAMLPYVIGRRTIADVARGELLTLEMLG
jgi:N,N'-diacetyllegionaminate synthase